MSETTGSTGPRERLSAAVAAQLDHVRSVFDTSPIGVGVWSVDGVLAHANPVLCELVGRPAEELVGEVFAAFIHPAHEDAILEAVDAVLAGTRNFFECDIRAARPDGRELWLRAHLYALYGPAGEPEHLVSQVFDLGGGAPVGERPPVVVEHDVDTPALLWWSDADAVPRRISRGFAAFAGLPGPVPAGPEEVHAAVHVEDRARVDDAFARARDEPDPVEATVRVRRADGTWRWLALEVHAHRGTGPAPVGYTVAMIDITAERERIDELETVAQLFDSVTEAGPLAVLRTNELGEVQYANVRWEGLVDEPESRLLGRGWRDLLITEHADEIERRCIESINTREPFVMRVRAQDDSLDKNRRTPQLAGRYWGEVRIAPVFDHDDRFDGFVATIADVSAEMAASERADRLARVLDAGSDYLLIVDRSGRITYVNSASSDELGIEVKPERQGPPTFLMDVLEADSFNFFHEVVEPVLVDSARWKGELTVRDAEGRDIPVSALVLANRSDDGTIESITVVARDISDLKQAQWRMRQLATHDYLTGLPNRVLLYERLDQALTRFHRLGQTVALLYLDLDRFKPINDTLGHHVGDAVLVTLADRIHVEIRETDTAARIGGDEFAVLVEGYDRELLERIAARLIDTMSAPIDVDGMTVQVGVSIGIVSADPSMTDADALLARADAAMYEAKAGGRGRFVYFDPPRRGPGAPERRA